MDLFPLFLQIWRLLCAFCNKPTDIASSFPSIARVLGTALSEKTEVRDIVCDSLKTLIESSRGNGESFIMSYNPTLSWLKIL